MRSKTSLSAADLPFDSVDGLIDRMARFGFITKGVVYAVIGALAVQAAVTAGGGTEGARGAIQEIGRQPFGMVLLGLAAIGLLAYALWRFIAAGIDPEGVGTDAKGIAKRLGYAVSGVIYLGLAVWAAKIVLGGSAASGGGGNGSSEAEWTARLMAQPYGHWLVGAVGVIIIGVGLFHFYRAYNASFMKRYDTGQMNARQRTWAKRMGRFGLAARGVTFCIIGGFLIEAAVRANPSETRGLAGALDALAQQPYGPWLLGIVAFGFIAYGVYCVSRARFSSFTTH